MGDWDTYCLLCAAAFFADAPNYQNGTERRHVPHKSRLQWLGKCRLIGKNDQEQGQKKCFITGPARPCEYGSFRCERGEHPAAQSLTETNGQGLFLSVYSTFDPNEPYCMAFHDSCYTILERAIHKFMHPKDRSLRGLSPLDTDILYFAMASVTDDYRLPDEINYYETDCMKHEQYWHVPTKLKQFTLDPIKIPEVLRFCADLPKVSEDAYSTTASERFFQEHPLRKLPPELLWKILDNVSLKDIGALFQGRKAPNWVIPPSWWKSRIQRTMPWLWELRIVNTDNPTIDWHTVCEMLEPEVARSEKKLDWSNWNDEESIEDNYEDTQSLTAEEWEQKAFDEYFENYHESDDSDYQDDASEDTESLEYDSDGAFAENAEDLSRGNVVNSDQYMSQTTLEQSQWPMYLTDADGNLDYSARIYGPELPEAAARRLDIGKVQDEDPVPYEKYDNRPYFPGLANRRRIWDVCNQFAGLYAKHFKAAREDQGLYNEIEATSIPLYTAHVGVPYSQSNVTPCQAVFLKTTAAILEKWVCMHVSYNESQIVTGISMRMLGDDEQPVAFGSSSAEPQDNGMKRTFRYKSLRGFELTISRFSFQDKNRSSGICGIKPLLSDADCPALGMEDGDKRLLLAAPGMAITGFIGETEVPRDNQASEPGKIMMIGLLQSALGSSRKAGSTSLREQLLWRPSPPPADIRVRAMQAGHWSSAVNRDSVPMEPLVFDTLDRPASKIVRIGSVIGGSSEISGNRERWSLEHMSGFFVEYKDGSIVHVGDERQDRPVHTVDIDGPGGERISGVETYTGGVVDVIVVKTNWERGGQLTQSVRRSNGPQVHSPKSSERVVGFYASWSNGHSRSQLTSFGLLLADNQEPGLDNGEVLSSMQVQPLAAR